MAHGRAPLQFVPALCLLIIVAPATISTEEQIEFVDVTEAAGIGWRHDNAASPEKYLIETMGGGGAFLDYDNDGWLDIFLANSASTPQYRPSELPKNALYRNNGDGSFAERTRAAGLEQSGFAMGVAVGDYDNDGDSDIYVTAFGPNRLYRNNGDGTFTDVTEQAKVGDDKWGTSAAFFDYDNDGWLDLYVCNYLTWSYEKNVPCGSHLPKRRSYCHPDNFPGIADIFYRNRGDGTFEEVGAKTGIAIGEGKGLGVVAADYNDDGLIDIYVANDAVRNFLFKNNGDGSFAEIGLYAGVAYGLNAKPESGMGVDWGDYDGDGRLDVFVTNIDFEPNDLYRYLGQDIFENVTIEANLGQVAMLYSGFGTRFLDYDNDSDLDIFVSNGHPLDDIELLREKVTYAELPFLLENRDGRFIEVAAQRGHALQKRYAGRGLAVGDYDNDGDADLLMINSGEPPALLRNDGGNRNNWVGLRLVGTRSNRDAVGAKVTVAAAGLRLVRHLVGGASYCSAHDARLLFGLGKREKVDYIEIRWPSGAVDKIIAPPINRYIAVTESSGF